MVQHTGVSTTCTASHLINWDIPNLASTDAKLQVNARLNTVNDLIKQGYKRDFAILFVTVTDRQMQNNRLDEFLPKCGFELVFKGTKFDDEKVKVHRHKETGDLYLWATSPKQYEEALGAYKAELTELKDKIDPPKKPDPARQKFPDLLLSDLRKNGIVVDNAKVDNRMSSLLLVPPAKAQMYLKMKFGFDVTKYQGWGETWTTKTARALKEAQKAWKNELV